MHLYWLTRSPRLRCGIRKSWPQSSWLWLMRYICIFIFTSRFMPNTFTDLSDECAREGKIGRFLDMANPALYIRWVVMSAVELEVQYKCFPLQIGHPRNSGIAKDHLQQNIQLRNRDSNCECRAETLQHLDLNSSQLMVASISVVTFKTENIGFLCSTFLQF